MKSKKSGKLTFNKSTVAQLDNQDLDALRGGSTSSWWTHCRCDSNLDTTCNGTGGGGSGGSINP